MRMGSIFLGLILILIGLMFIAHNVLGLKLVTLSRLWPFLVLGVGMGLEFGYFLRTRRPGILLPGGIITILGLLFLFETFTGWQYSSFTWPVYPLAIAFGLFPTLRLFWS